MYMLVLLAFAALPPQAPMPPQAPTLRLTCQCPDLHCGCSADSCRCTPTDRCSEHCPCWLTEGLTWREFGDGDNLWLADKDGKQVGAWSHSRKEFRPCKPCDPNGWDKCEWGKACKPPLDVPVRVKQQPQPAQTHVPQMMLMQQFMPASYGGGGRSRGC